MAIEHLIFDCDGVLVDSEPLSMRIDVEIMAENGVMLSEAAAHARFVGKTFAAMLGEIAAEFGVSLPADASSHKDLRLLALYERELKAVDGVRQALEMIGHHRYSVASNSPAERVEAALRIAGLTGYFGNRVTTFEHVPRAKPEPDVFIEAARRAGYRPEQCIVIEDSLTGVTAAHRAGCRVLGFTGTHPTPATHSLKLRETGAAQIFHRMSELPALVEGFLHDA